MKNVVSIVLNNFTNDSRVLKEAISLKRAGYYVTVIALHEKSLADKEIIQDIYVRRFKLKTRNWSKIKIVQLIKYLEFLIKIVIYHRNTDIFHLNGLAVLPFGVFTRIIFNRNLKIVYDAHEYETERNGHSMLEKKFRKFLERLMIKFADKVITVSESIAEEYQRLYKIKKPSLVLNCPDYKECINSDIFRKQFNISNDKIIYLYQGAIGRGRGIENIIDAFKTTDHSNVLVIMGFGSLENLAKQAAKDFPNIFFQQAVPPDILLNYTSSADIGLCLIENTCLSYYYCAPNKLFEYIMAGLLVIVPDLYELSKIVKTNEIGVVIDKNTPESIKNALDSINNKDIQKFKKNTTKLKEVFNWEQQEKVLLKTYSELYK
ncbi:MAG: glycosyltransferase family 4 protein [bacterium]